MDRSDADGLPAASSVTVLEAEGKMYRTPFRFLGEHQFVQPVEVVGDFSFIDPDNQFLLHNVNPENAADVALKTACDFFSVELLIKGNLVHRSLTAARQAPHRNAGPTVAAQTQRLRAPPGV